MIKTEQQFLKLFPLKVKVTQEILDRANIIDHRYCIGALSLSKALARELGGKRKLDEAVSLISWLDTEGVICTKFGNFKINSSTDMMEKVKTPQFVTFNFDGRMAPKKQEVDYSRFQYCM